MDFCFMLIGCSHQLKVRGGSQHQCPRCNNGSVVLAKDQRCLELFCIPVLPIGSKEVYHCSICNWQASSSGPAPPLAGQGYSQQQQGYAPQPQMQPMQPGYGGGGYGGPPQQQYGGQPQGQWK